ncbi:Hsp20/alpha crystallin family protein [Bradyrhizobium sediminis]|uniref:Hsp20/alpha crystallin family protein n=1 Tax=Bradyrhizobium sediminis TaxID=2840469 RepID=A0A975NAK4_9BRAD|nr:Hsp20/alpha crystallin family protein [Bradyrhizobium sediminis]QWG11542.1 Hsp20/alpha crystallin family protein [Bradyrhizobium sediminis]
MAEAVTKLPVKTEGKKTEAAMQTWRPFDSLRREVDRLFENFDRDLWRSPFSRSVFDIAPYWRGELKLATTPAVDIVEKDNAYEVTAELPGMDEKNIEVKLDNGGLTIKGEKQEEKEEKRKGYHLQERRFGSFERYFTVPEGVDTSKIEANFKKGVLTVTLPKKPEAQKPAKKIEVKAG